MEPELRIQVRDSGLTWARPDGTYSRLVVSSNHLLCDSGWGAVR